MDFSGISALILRTDNAYAVLILCVCAAMIYFAREIVKLRTEIGKIKSDQFSAKKDSIVSLFKIIDELKKYGATEHEIFAIKDSLFRELNIQIPTVGREDPAGRRRPNRSQIPTLSNNFQTPSETLSHYILNPDSIETSSKAARFSFFFKSMFLFGFMAVWSLGWGWGFLSFALEVFPFLWNNIVVSTNIIQMACSVTILLFAVVVYIGIGVVPVVLSLGGLLGGLAGMISALFPKIGKNRYVLKYTDTLPKWR
jgi:hypothetical protein